MANNNNETTTKFKVDIAELKSQFTEARRQIQLANSEFKAATGGMDDWTKSADGLSAKLKQLKDVLTAQKSQLATLEQQYALVVKEQGEGSKGAEELRIKINNQKAAIGNTEKQIRNYNTQLDNLGKEEDDDKKKTDDLNNSFTTAKAVMADLVSAGIKALIQGLKDVAKYAKEAYQEFDKGYDNLIKATGATGESAKALEDSYKNVSKSVKADMGDIGSAIGEVNTRFGYADSELEKASEAFLKFAEVTGTDATQAVQLVSRAMENAGIDADDYQNVLDKLTTAGQVSGISVSKLTESLTKNGTTMRALGFDTDESIAILSKFEKEGVNTETALTGMKTAFKQWAEDGKNAKREYERMVRTIALTSDSTEAAKIAVEVFGKKAGPEMAELIQQGKLSYGDYLDVIEGSAGTVESTYEQTQDAFDKIQLAAQGLKTDVATAMKDMLDEYAPEIDELISTVKDGISAALQTFMTEILPAIKDGISWIIDNLPLIEALVVGIGTAFAAWKVVGLITAITTALEGMTAAEVLLAAKQWLLNTAIAANPIGAIITAIAALVAAFITLWNTSDEFRQFWYDFGDSVLEVWETAVDGVTQWIDDLVWAWKTAIQSIKDYFADIGKFWKDTWENLKSGAKDAWEGVKEAFSGVVEWFGDVFSKAWQKVKDVFSTGGKIFTGIKEGIVETFKTVVNGIIRGINKVVSIPFNAINKVLDKLRNVDIAGVTPFDWINTFDVPQIPELARGGVLKRGQIGLLEGNGSEAVVPLEKNTRWLDEIASRIYDKMSAGGNTPSPAQGVVNNFYQTNNSPKALSRLEIYRQSKNLLRMQGG
jgi:TP901 family phage tail tape measure protein